MRHTYYFDEYYKDVSNLVKRYKKCPNPHIVAVCDQSLPFAVHLSNLLECPISYLRVEDKATWVLNNTENRDIRPNGCPLFPYLICVDTIFKENVFNAIKELPEFIKNPDYTFYSLFGHSNELRVHYTHELLYKEVNFPWQRMITNSDLVL